MNYYAIFVNDVFLMDITADNERNARQKFNHIKKELKKYGLNLNDQQIEITLQ